MAEIIATEFQRKRKSRNSSIAKAFRAQKKSLPGAANADCIRGLAAEFHVSEGTVRIALKEEKLL